MRRLFLFVLALTLTLAGTATFTTSRAGAAADMDCGDFATQAAAQAFFVSAGPGDPHALDHDGDGIACETNPCPCSTSVAPLVGTPPSSPTSSPTAVPTTTPSTTTPSTPTPTQGVDPDGSGSSGPERRDRARVVRVTDGDTLRVRMADGSEEYVRIIGIDTPEVHGRRECGGAQASRTMRRLAPVGSRVLLVSDPTQADRDRYGRLLRYVHRSGTDVGRAQVVAGRARVYVYRSDPFRRTAAYQRAERRAAAQHRGAWGTCWR